MDLSKIEKFTTETVCETKTDKAKKNWNRRQTVMRGGDDLYCKSIPKEMASERFCKTLQVESDGESMEKNHLTECWKRMQSCM